MKLKTILAGALALGITSSAMAQTTEITITGATAFRQATMRGIYEAYASEGALGTSFNVAHDFNGATLSQLIASNKAVFSGKFPGITGTTIIRTSFNGSTEGLNAIAGNNNPTFLTTGALTGGSGIIDLKTSPTETLRPKFSFSDVYQETSPVQNEVLNPVGASKVGVVTFAMIANEGAPANWTNTTIQQCKALWQTGIQRLSLFTGNPADSTLVFATGRNDGSGTRSAYLTEWSYGVANTVNQYVVTKAGLGSNNISAITAVPVGDNLTNNSVVFNTGRSSDASTLWGNDSVGNGGYSSSSALRGIMGLTSTNVTVYDGEDAAPIIEGADVHLLTWLSTADSLNAANNGAKILAFNGEKVTPIAAAGSYLGSGFSEADFNKIARGAYSAWSYQHLYYHGSIAGSVETWYDSMTAAGGFIEQGLQLTSNGLRLSDMSSERPDDGFPIVAPLF